MLLTKISLGDLIADKLSSFIGSWGFIIGQAILMVIWGILNTLVFFRVIQFDPYPFVFLNLFMSAEAAFSTPLILMSQNRSDARDRDHAEHHYTVSESILATLSLIQEHIKKAPQE